MTVTIYLISYTDDNGNTIQIWVPYQKEAHETRRAIKQVYTQVSMEQVRIGGGRLGLVNWLNDNNVRIEVTHA